MAKKPEWPEELVQEILIAYVKEYLEWSDTTHGPSLIGTRNDLYRCQMSVMESYAVEYSDVDYYYKEIISLFDTVDLSKIIVIDDFKEHPIAQPKIIEQLNSQKETLKMAEFFSRRELTLFEKLAGSISAIILYGIGFTMLFYLLINAIQ